MTHVTRGADPYKIAARIERLPITFWHHKMRTVIGAAWFFDGFDALAIAYVLPVLIGMWKLTPGQIAWLIAAGYVGQTIGSVAAGWFAERWGRVPVLAVTLLIFTFGSFACVFAWDYDSLVSMRLLQGIGLGGEIPIMHAYMSEFAKAGKRGRFALIVQILFSIGLAAVAYAANWVVPFGWQYLFLLGAVPALLIFPMRLLLLESPRWLVAKGRDREADAIVTKIEQVAKDEGKVLPELPSQVERVSERKPYFAELFQGMYRKRTFTLWTMWVCTYFIGYGLQTWLPSLYRTAFKLSNEEALRFASTSQIVQLIGGFTCVFAIDYIGRKILIGGGLCVVAASLLYLGLLAPKLDAYTVFWAVTLGLPFLSFGNIGLGIWTAENYPNHLRALGSGVAGAWLRAASVVGPFAVGWLLPNFGLNAVFTCFGISAVIGAITCFIFALETKGQPLEKISPPLDAPARA